MVAHAGRCRVSAPAGQPTASVVIPTHNRIALLPETLDRVLAERSLSIEVIVVDDRSTDDTAHWLARVDDPRVSVIRLDPGRGGSAARNAGLEKVRAPYVMFLDDDDLVQQGALRRLVEVIEQHPDVVVAGGTYVTIGEVTSQHRQPMVRRITTTPIWREQIWGWNLQPGAGLWRTEFVRSIGGWDTALERCEDLDLNLRTHGHEAVLIPDTTVFYRHHAGQLDDERRRHEWALDAEVRSGFVERLPGRDRSLGRRILASRTHYFAALEAYEAGHFAGCSSVRGDVPHGAIPCQVADPRAMARRTTREVDARSVRTLQGPRRHPPQPTGPAMRRTGRHESHPMTDEIPWRPAP